MAGEKKTSVASLKMILFRYWTISKAIDNSFKTKWTNWKKEKRNMSDKRKRSFAVWWIVPELHKNNKIQPAPFTAGQDWIIGTFFLRSQAMDEEMLIRIHFPQRLSWPDPPNLFSLPLLIFAKSLLFLSTFSCHIFFLLLSSFFNSVCLVNRQNFNHTLVEILRWQWRFLHET